VDQGDAKVTSHRCNACLGAGLLWLLAACGQGHPDADTAGEGGAGGDGSAGSAETPYAQSVEAFEPGQAAGFGADALPGVVLGPPAGKGNTAGSLDVLSLGAAGEIVLAFGAQHIEDGPGADFIVFENAFWPGGDASKVFAELGEVSVSNDAATWDTFPCDTTGDGGGNFPGCAGVTPTLEYDPLLVVPLDAEQTGGDSFDLADLGLTSARYVRIRDLETLEPAGNTSGFDLDAVGLIHRQ
jgi:hypothetical protein